MYPLAKKQCWFPDRLQLTLAAHTKTVAQTQERKDKVLAFSL
jgi:hypothetical protein